VCLQQLTISCTCLAIFSKSSNQASRPRLTEDNGAQRTATTKHAINSASITVRDGIFESQLQRSVDTDAGSDKSRARRRHQQRGSSTAVVAHITLCKCRNNVKYYDALTRRGINAKSSNQPHFTLSETSALLSLDSALQVRPDLQLPSCRSCTTTDRPGFTCTSSTPSIPSSRRKSGGRRASGSDGRADGDLR